MAKNIFEELPARKHAPAKAAPAAAKVVTIRVVKKVAMVPRREFVKQCTISVIVQEEKVSI